jgi:hypothetical protein
MLMLFGLILGSIAVVAAIIYEVRSALFGVALSNGVEVLVSREMYWSIVRRYQADHEPDDRVRWDHAVLDILRPVRPNEWRFLVRSLGYQVATVQGAGMRRQRQAQTQTVWR